MDLHTLQSLLNESDLEVYLTEGDTLFLAERVRIHLMDSGVTVTAGAAVTVAFTVRSEASQFPSGQDSEHFDRARKTAGPAVREQGYAEISCLARRIEDPVDPEQTLDTWYEVRFGKTVADRDVVAALRYCLGQPKTTG